MCCVGIKFPLSHIDILLIPFFNHHVRHKMHYYWLNRQRALSTHCRVVGQSLAPLVHMPNCPWTILWTLQVSWQFCSAWIPTTGLNRNFYTDLHRHGFTHFLLPGFSQNLHIHQLPLFRLLCAPPPCVNCYIGTHTEKYDSVFSCKDNSTVRGMMVATCFHYPLD